MKSKHLKTLKLIFNKPVSANVRFKDVATLLQDLGAEFEQRSESRIAITLNGDTVVQHVPHPSPCMDKGAVASLRNFLAYHGVKP